jgi:lipase chaperone LimK
VQIRRNKEGDKMNRSYIRLGLSGIVMLSVLATALHFSNEEQLTAITQPDSQNDGRVQTAPAQIQTYTEHQNSQHDTRYSNNDDLSTMIPVSFKTSEYLANSMYGDFPLSMKGTTIPILYLDQDGNLIQDRRAREFIEYFISTAREEGTYTSVGRMQEYFDLALTEPALSQANTLLDKYMEYRMQLDSVVSRNDVILAGDKKMAALRETLERRKALRRDTLGNEVAQAMFGDSERYEAYAVNMLQTAEDQTLTKEQKLAQIAQHEESLPPHIRAKVRYKREEQQLQETIRQLHQQGNASAEIFELRKAFYGEGPAKKLAYMDEKSDEWVSRVQQFNQQKEQILASVIMDEQQKRQQINELRNRQFNEDEKMKMAWQALQ